MRPAPISVLASLPFLVRVVVSLRGVPFLRWPPIGTHGLGAGDGERSTQCLRGLKFKPFIRIAQGHSQIFA